LRAGREKELARASQRIPLEIVDEVRKELEADPQYGGRAFANWLTSSSISIRRIPLGSEAAATFAQLLHPKDPHKDLGERASIALVASEPALVLVTHDKNALWIAIREIWRGSTQVMGIAPFMRLLFDQGALADPDIADEVINLSGPLEQRPTWWAPWRAALSAPAAPSAPTPPCMNASARTRSGWCMPSRSRTWNPVVDHEGDLGDGIAIASGRARNELRG
jgi:hypothetical protein